MTYRKSNSTQNMGIDWITFSVYLSLVFIGWLMIFAAEYKGPDTEIWSLATPVGKQTAFMGAAFVLMLLILNIDWKFWRNFSFVLYSASILMLILVLFLGREVNGAQSWFNFGGFGFQPSEFAKFATCLAVSSYLAGTIPKLKQTKHVLAVMAIFLTPMALIMLQPDPGSALVFLSFFIVLYREGLSAIPYVVGIAAALIFILALLFNPLTVLIVLTLVAMLLLIQNLQYPLYWNLSILFLAIASVICIRQGLEYQILIVNLALMLFFVSFQWIKGKMQLALTVFLGVILFSGLAYGTDYVFNNVLKPHHQDRINVWLHPEKCDPQGPLYNVLLSKMAIGSGGFSGKGFLEGTLTKLNYVPAQSTDFIFCTVGEEQGFVGSLIIVGLFVFLMVRIITIAERQRLNMFRHYAYGVAGILFLHFTINMGMTMGLLPIIGIPLPFISYGGSSLLVFTLMIGVLLRFDSQRYLN